MSKLKPIHPGEILKEEFILPLHLRGLARHIGIKGDHLADICAGKADITADDATKLSLFYKTSPDFWSNLQGHYNKAQRE